LKNKKSTNEYNESDFDNIPERDVSSFYYTTLDKIKKNQINGINDVQWTKSSPKVA
jgi:hypothetical protein